MEKRSPTFSLEAIQAALGASASVRMTRAAASSSQEFGFELLDVADLIRSITYRHFYKSMTSHGDHTVWQDVYHVPSAVGMLYVKFTTDDIGFKVISFKEKDNE